MPKKKKEQNDIQLSRKHHREKIVQHEHNCKPGRTHVLQNCKQVWKCFWLDQQLYRYKYIYIFNSVSISILNIYSNHEKKVPFQINSSTNK